MARVAPRFEALRYTAAACLLASAGICLSLAASKPAPDEASREIGEAVMVDLPAEPAAAPPAGDAGPGPEQAAAAETPPTPQQAPSIAPREAEPATADAAPIASPAPQAEAAEPEKPAPVQPPAASAAPAAARDATAPPASSHPDAQAAEDGDEGRPRPTAHAITLWQRSLMQRLEQARRANAMRAGGTATIAFRIDARGLLVWQQVKASSGSPSLDAASLDLVRRAAPFPPPPAGSRAGDLAFTIAIHFR